MTKYSYLLKKKKAEICAYHLAHPEMSQWQVALHFNTSKKKVWNALRLLE